MFTPCANLYLAVPWLHLGCNTNFCDRIHSRSGSLGAFDSDLGLERPQRLKQSRRRISFLQSTAAFLLASNCTRPHYSLRTIQLVRRAEPSRLAGSGSAVLLT